MTFKLDMDCGANVAFNLTSDQTEKLMAFPQVVEYMVWKGLKEILTDAHASVVRKDFKTDDEWIEAKRAKASLKLGALMNGDVRTTSKERAPKPDDFTNFARKHVLGMMKGKAKSDSKIAQLVKSMPDLPDKGVSLLDAVFAKNESALRPLVQAELDAAIAKAESAAKLATTIDFDV